MLLSNGEVISLAPQALAETTPLLTTGYWYASDGLNLEYRHATYAALYRSQPWVNVVIEKLATATARLHLQVWDSSPDQGKVLDLNSPYAKLIGNPCPIMPTFGFWRWVVSTYEAYGECFLLKVRDDSGRVIGLLPMHPTRTAVKRDGEGNETFEFQLGVASAGLLEAEKDDVIPLRRYNPDTMQRGLSRLEPLRSTLINEQGARDASGAWWKNMGRPSVMLQSDNKLSDEAKKRLKQSWDAAQGGAGKAGGTVVLEEGLKANIVQLSAEELQYIESRKLNREEVCGVFDVPPPVVHILDNATYSNITEQMRSMYRDTMAPRLEDLESVLDFYLRPEFDTTGKLKSTFALDDVLRGDFETRASAVLNLFNAGAMTPNEIRPLFDLPLKDDENANKLYVNSAIQPLGTLKEQMTITAGGDLEAVPGDELLPMEGVTTPQPGTAAPPPGEQPAPPTPPAPQKGPEKAVEPSEAVLKGIRSRPEYRALMGRLGRRKGDLKAALVEEHAKALKQPWESSENLADRLLLLSAATAKATGSSVNLGSLQSSSDAMASALVDSSPEQAEESADFVVNALLLALNGG